MSPDIDDPDFDVRGHFAEFKVIEKRAIGQEL